MRRRIAEVTAGPLGTPFDTAASVGGPKHHDEASRIEAEIIDGLRNLLGLTRGSRSVAKMSDDAFAKFESWPLERQVRWALNMLGLSSRNDLHWDIMSERLPAIIAHRRKLSLTKSSRVNAEGRSDRTSVVNAMKLNEAEKFMSTAAEQAELYNSQDSDSGWGMSTDQAYWEEMGVSTGEDLARLLAFSEFSDMFKDRYGIRPRHVNWKKTSVDELEEMIAGLAEIPIEMDDWGFEDGSLSQRDRIEKERREEQDPLGDMEHEEYYDPYGDMPKSSGMRKRFESYVRSVVREALKR